MLRSTSSSTAFSRALIIAIAAGTVACGSNSIDSPTDTTPPVSVTESFSDTLNVNGARTMTFTASRAGTVTARVAALSPDDTVTVGLSLGTWNGSACAITPSIANDSAKLNTSVVGTANATGQYCARIYDVGQLTAATDYTIEVTHY